MIFFYELYKIIKAMEYSMMMIFPNFKLFRIEYISIRIIIFLEIRAIYETRIVIIEIFFLEFFARSQYRLCILNALLNIGFFSLSIIILVCSNDLCRDAYRNTIRRNILGHNRTYTNDDIITYSYTFKYCDIFSKPDIITNLYLTMTWDKLLM